MSKTLYGPRGEVLEFAKEKPPKTGDAYGQWAGRNLTPFELPGGGFLQFDLTKLRLSDYRQMTTHYQINSSLSLLAFMQYESPWHIEHPSAKIRTFLTESVQRIWLGLSRSMAQANWSGYAPSVLDWDNDVEGKNTYIKKVKDLYPEECHVNWKLVEQYAPPGHVKPKARHYDGIVQFGQYSPIPVESTYWYPMLMENGDYYGRKLLKSVYTSYFFSMLVHLYANRYYERFGEPTPIGRAPFDDDIQIKGETVDGFTLMQGVMTNLRNRGVVMLPSDKTPDGGSSSQSHYDYSLEYLESQMRGADFERMLARYDQEMSLGTFTPLLLQQTSDVGSYNLGGLHYQMYLNMQNAMNGDKANHVDNYIINPLMRYNFPKSAGPAHIIFDKQDNTKADLLKMIITALISKGGLGVNVEEIGQAVGLDLKEVKALTTQAPVDPNTEPGKGTDPNDPKNRPDGQQGDGVPAGQTGKPSKSERENLRQELYARVRGQVQNAISDGTFGSDIRINIPFTKRIQEHFGSSRGKGIENSLTKFCQYAVKSEWRDGREFADEFLDVYNSVTM